MAEARAEDERPPSATTDSGNGAGEGAAELPRGLRQDWPVPWQPLRGDKTGPWREVLSLATRALAATAVRLPGPLRRGAIEGMSRLLKRLLTKRSDVAAAYLTQALGEMPPEELDARVLQAWRHFLRVAVESERFFQRVPLERIREHFDVEWTPDAKRVVESERGCVIAAAHIGNWETATAILPWVGFDPFYGVAKPIRNAPFSKVVQRTRERRGIRLLPRRGAMRDAPKVIEAGGTVGLLLDQRARLKPVMAPLFGRLARCDRSAGVLIRRLKAPVVVAFCYEIPGTDRYRLEFPDCLWPEEVEGKDPVEIATRINRAFERMILRHPDQYFWLHDRYKDTPYEAVPRGTDPVPPEEPAGAPAVPPGPQPPSVVE